MLFSAEKELPSSLLLEHEHPNTPPRWPASAAGTAEPAKAGDGVPTTVQVSALRITGNPEATAQPLPPDFAPSEDDQPTLIQQRPRKTAGDIATSDTVVLPAQVGSQSERPLVFGDLPPDVQEAIIALARQPVADPHASPPSEAFADLIAALDTNEVPIVVRTAILEFTYDTLAKASTHANLFANQRRVSELSTLHIPSVGTRARTAVSIYTWASAVAVLLFAVSELVWTLRQMTGPFMDESLYIVAGLRTIEGFGISDGYMTWFAGSLLWPLLSACAYLMGGLVNGLVFARLLSVACTTLALIATWRASRNFFGVAAGFWTALTFALSGPLLHLAHLAVYDQVALAGISISLWAISKVGHTDERRWLLIGAIAFAIGVIGKYPMALCQGPLLGVMLALRRGRARADIFILLFLSIAVLLMYAVPIQQTLTQFFAWRAENNPSFGATSAMIRFSLLFDTFPVLVLAGVGWFVARGQRRLASSLYAGLLLWPLYHTLTNNSVGAEKHIVFGFLFGYPLVGVALERAWKQRGRWMFAARPALALVILALALIGAVQATLLDRGWADTRPAAAYLAAHVQPGERVLASNSSPYQLALYTSGSINSPWDVYDVYRVQHGEFEGDLCDADWFVDEERGTAWPADIRQRIEACGTFVQVYSSVSEVTALGRNLTFVTYPVRTTIWINDAMH